jgi:G:T/U-mismatch repair DNA glycosylase
MTKWYERDEIYTIRSQVGELLKLPTPKDDEREPAAAFWARLERGGLLLRALALYDQIAVRRAAEAQGRRETKEQFEQRVEQEGRRAEAERLRAALLASGLSQREAQWELVARLQPLDGTRTRAWATPDPWQAGRLFRKKADQVALLARASSYEDPEEDEEDEEDAKIWWRVECARRRREERLALAAARRRAQALRPAAAV